MSERNLWADVLIGVAAGAVGTAVMDQYFRAASKVQEALAGDDAGGDGDGGGGRLDDISITSIERREDENATTTLARAAHERVTGEEPSDTRKQRLGTAVHWGMGLSMGALYGLLRGRRDGSDVGGGLVFGAGVWAAADELMVPLLGLSKGPTAHSAEEHLQGLSAHLVYGATTALAAQSIARLT